jgi:FtsZ-binding cell division protein ZapB
VPITDEFPVIAERLQVFGDVRVGTSGTNGCVKDFGGNGLIGTCASDARLKRDITPFGSVLGQLTALQPVSYFWRASEFPERGFGDSRADGLIAQDVERVLPELVVTDAAGFKAVNYSKLPLLTIQAIKELKAQNEDLAAQNQKLRAGNEELKTGNEELKQRVGELERLFKEMLASVARR